MVELESIALYIERQIKECIVNSLMSKLDWDKNFFGDELNYKSHEVAAVLYKCFSFYNVDLYDKIELEDLTVIKISKLISDELLLKANI